MGDVDQLYSVRSLFYLGHYQQALQESSALPRSLSPHLKLELKTFLIRCHLSLLDTASASRLIDSSDAHPAIKACDLLCGYLSKASRPADTLNALGEFLSDPGSAGDPTAQIIAAQIYMHENMTKEAMQLIHLGQSMEALAVGVQIYLGMARRDLAQSNLSIMQRNDEDSILCQLASAWVSISTGSSTCEQALYNLQTLSEQYGPSVMLLNSQAVAKMSMGDYSGAEAKLIEAMNERGAAGPKDNADTLINLAACYTHMPEKKDKVGQIVGKIKEEYPGHEWVKKLQVVEGAVERVAKQFV